MKISNFYRPALMILIGFILGFIVAQFAPSFREIRSYIVSQEEKERISILSEEEKEIINQLDLVHDYYDFFKDIDFIPGVIRNFISDVWAETLPREEEEIIENLDLYENYIFWGEVSKDGELVANITEEEWKMLEGNEDLDYYTVIKIKKEGEENEE